MISSLGNGLAWTQHGQRVPSDSMTMYAMADEASREIKDTLKSTTPDQIAEWRAESTALKAQADKQVAAVQSDPTLLASKGKEIAQNVLMCAVNSAIIDTVLYSVLHEAPKDQNLPSYKPIAGEDMLPGFLEAMGDAPRQAVEAYGEHADEFKQGLNLGRSRCDEIIEEGTKPEAAGAPGLVLGTVFMTGYAVGCMQAMVDNSLQ